MSQCPGHSNAGDRNASSTVLVSRIHSKLRHAQLSVGQECILHAPYNYPDGIFRTNMDAN